MPQVQDSERLEQRRREIRAEIASIGDLRPGSLIPRFRKCGKPNCHCAQEGDPGHGPSWSLTRSVEGKTVTKIIPPDAVDRTKKQIDEYQRLRKLTAELVEVSVGLCDAQLSDRKGAAEAAKKGASKKRSG